MIRTPTKRPKIKRKAVREMKAYYLTDHTAFFSLRKRWGGNKKNTDTPFPYNRGRKRKITLPHVTIQDSDE